MSAVSGSVCWRGVPARRKAPRRSEVQNAWARASTGTTGAAYFGALNNGTAPDRLMAITTSAAQEAQLHRNKMENSVMEMRPLGPLASGQGNRRN